MHVSKHVGNRMVTHQLRCKLSTCRSKRLGQLLEEHVEDVLGITHALKIHLCEHLGEGESEDVSWRVKPMQRYSTQSTAVDSLITTDITGLLSTNFCSLYKSAAPSAA